MAMIRVPESSAELLQFVRNSPTEREGSAVFPTYAHLVAAAAGLAVAKGLFSERPVFKEQDPRPIDYAVFRNQKLLHPLMAFAIAHARDPLVCGDPDKVCRTVEGLADAGFGIMTDLLLECGAVYWPGEWEQLVTGLLVAENSGD
jgi:hypothetical protein